MIRGDSRGRMNEQVPKSIDDDYDPFERYPEKDQMSLSFENAEISHGYSQPRFGSFASRSYESFGSFETNSSDRYGTYESYDTGTSKVDSDVFDSGYGSNFCGFDDAFLTTGHDDESSSWDGSYCRSSVQSCGRSTYSSFSDLSAPSTFSTLRTRPGPIGSRGRGLPAYFQNQYGGRSCDLGAPTARGRGRGFPAANMGGAQPIHNIKYQSLQTGRPMERPQFGRHRSAIPMDYQHMNPNQPDFRGMKRKMMVPIRPTMFIKKQKLVRTGPDISVNMGLNVTEASYQSEARESNVETEVNQKRLEARREKQRRRREKNNEKYGDMYRLAFTCTFCKFRTFEDKDIEKHFGSTYHRETLDYIRRQAKFEDGVISFLHDSMVHKFRKTVSRKLHNCSDQRSDESQKVMEGVTEDDYMRKMEMVHCMACDTHIPAVFVSVQQHLKSAMHLKNKVWYKEQLKRESVLTANSIINSPNVKARYEKYIKGEDPFDTEVKDDASSGADEECVKFEGHQAENGD